MPDVACPRCGGTRPLAGDASGYTCAECGAAWEIVACANCRVRFHMRPGTEDWICPECGNENGSATMGALEQEFAPAPEVVRSQTMPATRGGPPRRSARGPMSRATLAILAILGIATVIAVAVVVSSLGGGDAAVSPSPTAPSPSATTTEALCLHLRDLQTPREDSLTRLADTLKADATAIKAEGDAQLGADVVAVRKAVLAYRDALAAQADLTDVSAALGQALAAMPC